MAHLIIIFFFEPADSCAVTTKELYTHMPGVCFIICITFSVRNYRCEYCVTRVRYDTDDGIKILKKLVP